jgi:hypothetical protein
MDLAINIDRVRRQVRPGHADMIEAVTTRPSDFAVCRLIISSNRMAGWCRDNVTRDEER